MVLIREIQVFDYYELFLFTFIQKRVASRTFEMDCLPFEDYLNKKKKIF